MTERQLTFTDLDENTLRVTLKQDRMQLSVVDSRPELEGAELRAFAAALFAEYVGPHLLAQIRAARIELIEARDRPPADERSQEVVAAVADALRALDDVARLMTSGRLAVRPVEEPGAPTPAPSPASATPILYLTPRGRRPRTPRAGEGGGPPGPPGGYSRCSYS